MFSIARLTVVTLFLLALSLTLLGGVLPAAAQDQSCDHLISAPGTNTVGITISAPGIYCLTTDMIMAASFTTGNAIEIAANYVTLDLNGHKIHGAAAGLTTKALGIHAVNRRNVTVKNGTVWGFDYGIQLQTSPDSSSTLTGYLVERVRAELNRTDGIFLEGANCIVRQNVVANTGPPTGGNFPGIGIEVISVFARVVDNDILTVRGGGTALGDGIAADAPQGLVEGNRITDADVGVHFSIGSVKARNNLTNGVATPFRFSFIDAGGNN